MKAEELLRRVLYVWDWHSARTEPESTAFQLALDAVDGALIQDVRDYLGVKTTETPRRAGWLAGKIHIADDFDATEKE